MSNLTWSNDTVRLGELKPWAGNPRLSTKAQAKRLIESWREFGQVETIAIGPCNEVYNGHQRLSALLTVYGRDYAIDVRRASRELSEDERRKLTIMLHAGAVGSWNWDSLSAWDAAQLGDWGMDADTLEGWRRDTAALTQLVESEVPDFEPVGIDEQGRLDQKAPVTCPNCGHEFVPKA